MTTSASKPQEQGRDELRNLLIMWASADEQRGRGDMMPRNVDWLAARIRLIETSFHTPSTGVETEPIEWDPDAPWQAITWVLADNDHLEPEDRVSVPVGELRLLLRAALSRGAEPSDGPVPLAVCEAAHILLRPDTLYRTYAQDGCHACEAIAQSYAETIPETGASITLGTRGA